MYIDSKQCRRWLFLIRPPRWETRLKNDLHVLISALPWGQEWQEMEGNVLWRESVQCTMSLYRGDFSDVQLCDAIKAVMPGMGMRMS